MSSQTLSLYLDLEPGRVADIDTVARAALAYSQAVYDIAYILDPSLDVRVELISGSQSSLSLNSRLRSLKDAASSPETLRAIALGLTIWFVGRTSEWTFNTAMDALFRGADGQLEETIGEEELQEIARRIEPILLERTGSAPIRQLYQELERDEAVRGVGLSSTPGRRPTFVVPRSEFSVRADTNHPPDTALTRLSSHEIEVVLVSPVLIEGKRRWRFLSHVGEFGAPVLDERFMHAVLSGTTSVPMRAGIRMNILLETDEELVDGVWKIVARRVMRVYSLTAAPTQSQLFDPPPDKK